MAHAVKALVAHEGGRPEDAAEAARTALDILQPRLNPTQYLDVLWAAGRVLVSLGEPEAEGLMNEIKEDLGYLDATIVDTDVKARWFSVPMHKELVTMTGYEPAAGPLSMVELPDVLDDGDLDLLRFVTSGSNDDEIASRMGVEAAQVPVRVSELLGKLGVDSRAAATEVAIKAGIA